MESNPNRPERGGQDPGAPSLAAQLEKSEHFAIALLEPASQGILAVDAGGTIVLANTRAEEIFGCGGEELRGAPIETLIPPSRRQAHAREREGYFASPRIRPMGTGMELVGIRRDGTEFPVEVSLSYVRLDSGLVAIAFVSDISRRQELEEQLMHAQKMEAVGRLAGGVAHDFNNMLTVISGYNRMLLDKLPPLDPLRACADEIEIAAERASALTSQLLVFSRRHVTRPAVLKVNELISDTEKMLRRLIGEDITLVLDLALDAGLIKADPSQIEQAVANLVVNARDAMPGGGLITIETSNVTLDAGCSRIHPGVQPGDFVMIAVSDTGHGMDAETRRHIFEPFFTTKPKGKGAGLGLSIVYGMVKQSGGDIRVYSEPDKGAAFKLYFPRIAEPAGDTVAGAAGASPARNGETILVVEDEQAVRELTARMLREVGCNVLSACHGAEAVEISRSYAGHIHLLLTDVVMPGMSVQQVVEALRPARPGIRVLYVSGYTDSAVVNHGMLEGGADFLPKPFNRQLLLSKVRDVLSER